jgi:hypothetical protein
MTKLPASFVAFQYQSGVDRIELAYNASISKLSELQISASDMANAYRLSGADDSLYEYDAGGERILITSTQHELDYVEFEIIVAREFIYHAFIHAIFHYWEKCARSLTNAKPDARFPELIKKMEKSQYKIDTRPAGLNALNNWIKHANPAKIEKIIEHWPDLIIDNSSLYKSEKPILHIKINNATVTEAFNIVKKSGPQLDRLKETSI